MMRTSVLLFTCISSSISAMKDDNVESLKRLSSKILINYLSQLKSNEASFVLLRLPGELAIQIGTELLKKHVHRKDVFSALLSHQGILKEKSHANLSHYLTTLLTGEDSFPETGYSERKSSLALSSFKADMMYEISLEEDSNIVH